MLVLNVLFSGCFIIATFYYIISIIISAVLVLGLINAFHASIVNINLVNMILKTPESCELIYYGYSITVHVLYIYWLALYYTKHIQSHDEMTIDKVMVMLKSVCCYGDHEGIPCSNTDVISSLSCRACSSSDSSSFSVSCKEWSKFT